MIDLKQRQPDEYGLSTTELGRKVMLDFHAAFSDLSREEKAKERKAVDVRRKIEDIHANNRLRSNP